MKPRAVWLPLAAGLIGVAAILLARRSPEATPAPPLRPPAEITGAVAVPAPEAPAPLPPMTPPPTDPLLRRWHGAVKRHDRVGVEQAQAAFLGAESVYLDPLLKLSVEDSDPRIRAFTIAVLGRFKAGPPESYFIERLGDASEYPRTSAAAALERRGGPACLSALDRLAGTDPSEGVRKAAAAAAKQVRVR